MGVYSTKLIDAGGTYEGGYTSEIYAPNTRSNTREPQGIIQVDITSGTVDIEGRLNDEATWQVIKNYTESKIEGILLPYQLRAVVSGSAKVFVGEQ